MTSAYVGIGSNLNQPLRQLSTAIVSLTQIPKTRFVQQSSFYSSKPLGFLQQPDFINAVVLLETSLTARELLSALQAIEQKQGRIRHAEKNAPRTLDLDLLLFAETIAHEEDLILPHPRMTQRAFVLLPLAEIAPALCLPSGEKLQDLIEALPEQGVSRLV